MFMYKCPVCETYDDVMTVNSPEYFGYYTVCIRCGRHTAVFEDPDTALESWKNGESSTEYSRVLKKKK